MTLLSLIGQSMNDYTIQSRLFDDFRSASTTDSARFEIQKGEALFGWSEIAPLVESKMEGLEIGAGSGLLSFLAADHGLNVVALEPVAEGFSHSEKTLQAVENSNEHSLRIERTSIDDYISDEAFDFIWSLNVFEHLPDWRAALDISYNLLKPGGRCLILCPNYVIPYEPHFSLPIIGSKSLTYRIFKKQIILFENSKNASGLWDSLNFITSPQVIRYCRKQGYTVHFDKGVMRRMFGRFMEPGGVGQRHKAVAPLIRLANKVGLSRLFNFMPVFMQPYMAITITKPDTPKS